MKCFTLVALSCGCVSAEGPAGLSPLSGASSSSGVDGDTDAIQRAIQKIDATAETWSDSFTESVGLIVKLARHEKVSDDDVFKWGMGVVQTASKLVVGENPYLGVACGFFSAIFGGMLGSGTDAEKQIYDSIMKVLPAKIDAEYMRLHLADEYRTIGGILDAHNLGTGTETDEMLVNDLIKAQRNIFGACWVTTLKSDADTRDADCLAWIKAGAFPLMYTFVDTALKAMLTDIINKQQHKAAQDAAKATFKSEHPLYVINLQRAAQVQYDWRNSIITPLGQRSCHCQNFPKNIESPQGTCTTRCSVPGGTDDLWDHTQNDFYRMQDGHGCHESDSDGWWANTQSLWNQHMAEVQKEFEDVNRKLNDVASLELSEHMSLKNPASGKCLDVPSGHYFDGNQVQLYSCYDGHQQHWEFQDGTLVHPASGKCLDIEGDKPTADGAVVRIWQCNGADNQKWILQNGVMVNPASGKCLDISGGHYEDETPVDLWSCNGLPNQGWSSVSGQWSVGVMV